MRYLAATIVGLIVLSICITITVFSILQFKVYPFYDFMVGKMPISEIYNSIETIFLVAEFVIVPLIAFLVTLSVSIISKDKELILSLIATSPLIIISLGKSIYVVAILIVVLIANLSAIKLVRTVKMQRMKSFMNQAGAR